MLGCKPVTVYKLLARPDWEDMRQAVNAEIELVADLAEENVVRALRQDFGPDHAVNMTKWVLTRKRYKARQMGEIDAKVQVEGGDKPIGVEQTNINIDALQLPVDVRRLILKKIEEQATQGRKDDEQA